MPYDYDALYAQTKDALGEPTPILIEAFTALGSAPLEILDIGCGQGRDALHLARLGHTVTGVDLAPHGIEDLNHTAQQEALAITGVVADISTYTPPQQFDVLLFDRTLHMLDKTQQSAVLSRLIKYLRLDGQLLIADEASNIPHLKAALETSAFGWDITLIKRAYLYARKVEL